MNLIYLHGPPASGKLTIARALAAQTGCGVFHNHLTMEVVKPFFEFDSKPFWTMVPEYGKLRSVAGLRAQLARWDCVAVPRAHCITITTEGRTPADCAAEIVGQLE